MSKSDDTTQAHESNTTELDDDLLALASAVESYALTARTLVRTGASESQKAHVRERLEAIRRYWRNVQPETGAPYRDARMLLTEGICFYSEVLRRRADGEANGAEQAKALSGMVGSYYPTLKAKLDEPDRVELIRVAILATSNSDKMPWKDIARVWDGIEAERRDPERWRIDWHEYRDARGWVTGNSSNPFRKKRT